MLATIFWASDPLLPLSYDSRETAAVENGKLLRVVVVGAGIVGASIAYHLARRQVAVTVLERHRPGAGASSHSFAWLNAFGKEPYPYHDLNRRSMEAWRRFAQDLQADVGLHWGGEMRWVHTAADAAALRQRIQHLQAWGYPNRNRSGCENRNHAAACDFWSLLGSRDGAASPRKAASCAAVRYSKTLRCCCFNVATTVIMLATKREPSSL